ncbi:MAG TPA: efflux RND transporter periplasmic adaptor subunit [Chthoniobacterales bacterium]
MNDAATVSEPRDAKMPPREPDGTGQQPARETPEAPQHKMRAGPIRIILFLVAVALAVLAFMGISARSKTTQETKKVADHAAEVTVNVVTPERAAAAVVLDLPGQTQAYTQAPIFAQTNGYVKKWYFDIGAKVKAGDVLAEIDTPEVDQQLAQAQAQLKEAQAALDLSRATYNRFQDLLKNKVIAAQDFDNQAGDYRVKEATVNADNANVRRLEALENFKQVRAPFDGIVTARNTDLGALINAGSGNPLFTVAQITPLRAYVNVPESMARYVREGGKADLFFNGFPGRDFTGKVARTSGAIDPNSRTLLTEIQVPNENGELFPGAYAMVRLQVTGDTDTFLVPANVLLFRSEGASVAVVNPEGKVEIHKVKIRRDLGAKLEISEGVRLTDRVVVNPGDGIGDGMKVNVNSPDNKPVAKS